MLVYGCSSSRLRRPPPCTPRLPSARAPAASFVQRWSFVLESASIHGSSSACRARKVDGAALPSVPITTVESRSNDQERPRGGQYFIYRPPQDGRRNTVHPGVPTRPPRGAVQVSIARFPSRRRVPAVADHLHRNDSVDAGNARCSIYGGCSGRWACVLVGAHSTAGRRGRAAEVAARGLKERAAAWHTAPFEEGTSKLARCCVRALEIRNS